jgi:O-acetylhomoserine (thiol)-lyase
VTDRIDRNGQGPEPEADATYGFETRAVHAGASPDAATGARNVPIYQTTSYVFDDVDHAAALFNLQTFGYIYSRITNPTVAALEEKVASLEGGRGAVACASGHAAQMLAFYTLLDPGDHVVAARQLYGGSLTQLRHTFKRLGWSATFVDATDLDGVAAAITPRTKAIFVESLANPRGLVTDLEALASIAHANAIPLVVDNTLATPYLCRPFEWGADLVIHSLTKFLSGHGTSMGGAVVESGRFDYAASGKFPFLAGPDPGYHDLNFIETFGDFGFTMKARAVALRDLGPALSPTNAFLILTGIETLPLRVERHVANARRVAEFLETHPAVSWVSWAGLPSNPSYELARKYMPIGPGSVFTFGVRGGFEAGMKVVETCELWSHLANVGDTRSLILHPASTTHRQLTDEEREAAGAGPDTIRLSVGIETVEDLIRDLDRALRAAAAVAGQPAAGRSR